jgi:MFS family permease
LIAPLALAQFICSFAGSNMNVMIDDISNDLNTSVKGVQTTITLFLLIMAVLMIPCSKLTDRWGRKRCLMIGLTLYGIGALLSAVAPGLGVLILGNSVLEGVGTALLIPPVYILATLWFSDTTSRAWAFGAISGLGGIGAAAGPLIGGVITTGISWRAAFVFQALVIVTIVLLSRNLDDPLPADPTRPFDLVGAILSAVGMFFIVFGILQAGENNTLLIVSLALGTLLLVAFFFYIRAREREGKEALLSTSLFKNRTCNLALITQNVQWLLLLGTSFVVSVFLQEVRGYNAIQTGVIFTAATLGVLAASLGQQRFAKRRAQKTLIVAGFVMVLVGIVLLIALVHASSRVVSRVAAGRDFGTLAQCLQPRVVLRHGHRRDDPGLRPRLGQQVLRPGADLVGSDRARGPRRRSSPARSARAAAGMTRFRSCPSPRRVPATACAALALPRFPVTVARNESQSSRSNVTSPSVRTVAVRGTSRSRAISPKKSLGPSVLTLRPSMSTSTFPLSIT